MIVVPYHNPIEIKPKYVGPKKVIEKLSKFEYIIRVAIKAEDEHMADGKLEIKLSAVFEHQYDVLGCIGEIKE